MAGPGLIKLLCWAYGSLANKSNAGIFASSERRKSRMEETLLSLLSLPAKKVCTVSSGICVASCVEERGEKSIEKVSSGVKINKGEDEKLPSGCRFCIDYYTKITIPIGERGAKDNANDNNNKVLLSPYIFN